MTVGLRVASLRRKDERGLPLIPRRQRLFLLQVFCIVANVYVSYKENNGWPDMSFL